MGMHIPPHPGEFIRAVYLEPFQQGNSFTRSSFGCHAGILA